MEQVKVRSRNTAMDIIRCLALFLVISVHFFLNNGFYTQPVVGKRMFVMMVIRTGSMVCVPLFLMLSGYLMCKKTISKKYYLGLVKTIGIYILASIACMLYKGVYLNENISLSGTVWGILNFSAANYSWYIEMFVGLFLLIPFLNILYNNIESKKHKTLLIITLLLLTSIPSIVNIYNFHVEGWWATPTLSKSYDKIMPSWWESIYPLTYYFIGCYLTEYKVKIKKYVHVLLLIGGGIVFGAFNYYRNYGSVFSWGDYQSWGALPNVILTVLLFSLLANSRFDKYPEWCRKLLGKLSNLCLGGYLVSYIFDNVFYQKLNAAVPDMTHRLNYYIIIVPLIFICSLALSFLLNSIYNLLQTVMYNIYSLIKK